MLLMEICFSLFNCENKLLHKLSIIISEGLFHNHNNYLSNVV